jgi:hypothetical protein
MLAGDQEPSYQEAAASPDVSSAAQRCSASEAPNSAEVQKQAEELHSFSPETATTRRPGGPSADGLRILIADDHSCHTGSVAAFFPADACFGMGMAAGIARPCTYQLKAGANPLSEHRRMQQV